MVFTVLPCTSFDFPGFPDLIAILGTAQVHAVWFHRIK